MILFVNCIIGDLPFVFPQVSLQNLTKFPPTSQPLQGSTTIMPRLFFVIPPARHTTTKSTSWKRAISSWEQTRTIFQATNPAWPNFWNHPGTWKMFDPWIRQLFWVGKSPYHHCHAETWDQLDPTWGFQELIMTLGWSTGLRPAFRVSTVEIQK